MNSKFLTIPVAITIALGAVNVANAGEVNRITDAEDKVVHEIKTDTMIAHGYAACSVRG